MALSASAGAAPVSSSSTMRTEDWKEATCPSYAWHAWQIECNENFECTFKLQSHKNDLSNCHGVTVLVYNSFVPM